MNVRLILQHQAFVRKFFFLEYKPFLSIKPWCSKCDPVLLYDLIEIEVNVLLIIFGQFTLTDYITIRAVNNNSVVLILSRNLFLFSSGKGIGPVWSRKLSQYSKTVTWNQYCSLNSDLLYNMNSWLFFWAGNQVTVAPRRLSCSRVDSDKPCMPAVKYSVVNMLLCCGYSSQFVCVRDQ